MEHSTFGHHVPEAIRCHHNRLLLAANNHMPYLWLTGQAKMTQGRIPDAACDLYHPAHCQHVRGQAWSATRSTAGDRARSKREWWVAIAIGTPLLPPPAPHSPRNLPSDVCETVAPAASTRARSDGNAAVCSSLSASRLCSARAQGVYWRGRARVSACGGGQSGRFA